MTPMKTATVTISLFVACSTLITACADERSGPQKDSVKIGHTEVFGELQRPQVMFPHELHMSSLDEQGCGACHHVYDRSRGKLVPADDDGTFCKRCHGAENKGRTPGLREAFHGQCTGCHRRRIREEKKAGPTTCGECHR